MKMKKENEVKLISKDEGIVSLGKISDIKPKKANYRKLKENLEDTVKDMLSKEYQNQFYAEYNQLVIRYIKLKETLQKSKKGELPFNLKSSTFVLEQQLIAMELYIKTLNIRIMQEKLNIKIFDEF